MSLRPARNVRQAEKRQFMVKANRLSKRESRSLGNSDYTGAE